ncbi:CST complex subunit CTC1 isoform X2 [Nymphaea colorata]|uniref:CST complex subunit CTC1 isoform X2 n=1 Tax=Nymphaea colorata TaxID=210225 RepID=UPI00129DCAAC|nr:CST complex subunit CTC1 isoform X2 [Nymphaea colorata]
MADVKKLSVSDLLLLSRPVTGAFSLSVSPSNPSDSSENAVPSPGRTRKRARGDDNQDPGLSERSPRILEPLDHPAILIGTVDLWTGVSDRRSGCSKNDCLLFADEGARVCCDVLELDIGMIGRRVTVLAWNFIPSKCTAGLLEIIKWELAEPPPHRWSSGGGSSEHGFYPLCPSSDSLQSEVRSFSGCRRIGRDEVSGQLTAVSPVFDVPCTAKSGLPDVLSESRPENFKGFLVEFLVCDCSECSSVMYSSHIYGSNVNPVTVYFCGAAAKWRPVFAKLVGSFIHVVGLKRKLVLVDVETIPMLVSTSKTGMRLYRKEQEVSNEGASTRKRTTVKNEFTGQYTGVATGVYMQGMVVELDEKVWLVFTDQLENPHSLRVGAIVDVRNAHFILPKFSWSKILLLGACVKTVLIIKRFSALATQCHVRSRTNSLLAKFVGSLPFIAKFWMLLMVSSFREKFSGILLEKEILGSKSKEGLVQIYAKLCFSLHSSQLRHGIFKEFCKHSCWDGSELGTTKLALPISYIFNHAESLWMRSLTCIQKQAKSIKTSKDVVLLSHERTSQSSFSRQIISSKDLGMVLLGMLQVSPSSGKLQLIDATGRVDAVVPDFRLHTNDQIMYKVDDFRLIMEGQPFDGLGIVKSNSAFCRNIFQHVAMDRRLPLTIYVHFYLKTATYIDSHMQLSASNHDPGISNGHLWGRFHLLFVTHKFPANYNVHVDKKLPNNSRLYAEAILTPFILFFPGQNGDCPIYGKEKILDKYLTYNHPYGHLEEHWFNKEGNFEVARTPFSSKVNDDVDNSGLDLHDMNLDTCPNFSFCHQHDDIHDLKQEVKTEGFEFPLDVSCSVVSSNYSNCCSCFRGIFSSVGNWNRNGDSEKSSGEVLLEFNSGSFEKFQVLHIGAYYIIRCDQDTSGCQLDDIKDSCSVKVLMTPKTQFWCLSFSSSPDHCKKPSVSILESVIDPLTNSSLIMNEVPLRYFTKNRLIHEKFKSHLMDHVFFDLDLHLPYAKLKFLRQVLSAVEDLRKDQSYTFREAHGYNGGVFNASTSCMSKIECLLLRGNFVCVCGEILDVHCLSSCSVASKLFQVLGTGNKSWLSFLLQGENGICIHVNEGHRMVKIRGTLDVHACPSGVGPGTIATFYRVLSSSSEGHVMVLTPATFIVVNVIKEVHHHDGGKFLASQIKEDVVLPSWTTRSSSLIFQSFHCFGSSSIQLRGQVVSVCVLVLEKRLHKYKKPCFWRSRKIPSVSIPLAGFIFDDGSLSCCCWASADSAAALLRLNKSASEVLVSKRNRNLCESGGPLHKVGDTLGKIIKKHRRIVVRSTCAAISDDLSCLDFSYSSCSNKTLSTSDQDLLKFIIINACSGPIMCVIGSVMGSDNLEFIQNYMDMPTKVYPPHHFWVEEASHVDALSEARSLVHDLTC